MQRDRTFRPAVIARDGLVCRDSLICRLRGERDPDDLEADHIHETQDGGPDDPDNGRMRCKAHHLRKTNRERRKRDLVLTRNLAKYTTLYGSAGLGISWLVGAVDYPTGIEPLCMTVLGATALGLAHDRPLRWRRRAHVATAPTPVKGGEAQRMERSLAKLFRDGEEYRVEQTKAGLVLEYGGTDLDTENDSTWARVERIASTKLGGRWVVEDDGVNDRALIRRRREFPASIPHPGLNDPARPWSWLPWGETETAKVAAVDLMVTAHVLVTGATGAGKTSLMRSLIIALADSGRREQVEAHLYDVKTVEMAEYIGMPGIAAVHTSTEEIYDSLVAMAERMQKQFDSGHPETYPALVLVIDEMRVLRSRLHKEAMRRSNLAKDDPRWETKPSTTSPGAALAAIDEILFLGRSGNVRIIMGVQRPDAKVLGGDVRAQAEGRLMVGHPDPDGARMMFGSSKWGADIPISAKGRTTVQLFEDKPEECQAWFVRRGMK